MNTKFKFKKTLFIIALPVVYAFVMRFLFDIHDLSGFIAVMSLTFFISLPFGVGMLTITLSSIEKVKSKRYRVFMPWVPICVFFLLTIVLSVEGWACWLMMLPVFLALASLGGLTAGYFKLKKYSSSNQLNVSIVALMPLVLFPAEDAMHFSPGTYKAYTFIDIQAPPQTIWQHVLKVKEISNSEDKGMLTNFLGFPRPLKAELNYAGVGASRKAVFTKGLVFDEVVMAYDNQKMMHFSITANTYNIPSTTLDKHILIGGDYFNVNDGTYMLQQLNDTTCRLHLYSHFTVTTNFNFYAAVWAGWIMKDIQNNILQVIKHRCEVVR